VSDVNAENLLWGLRRCDPLLLRIPQTCIPAEIPAFDPPSLFNRKDDGESWLSDCEQLTQSVRRLLTREVDACIVLAELSAFRTGRDVRREYRTSNLWFDKAGPDDPASLIPTDLISYASDYPMVGHEQPAAAIRHFPRMELHGAHGEWVALNTNAAESLGLTPDPGRLFGWHDGEDGIWTVRWLDGNPMVPPGEGKQGDGWLLVGTPGIADKIRQVFPDVQRHCVVRRQKGERDDEAGSVGTWSESL
jgi:hypothetical protein